MLVAFLLLEFCCKIEYQFLNLARKLNLGVNAGHDLDLHNLAYFLENVPADEVSIGHALISDSLIIGIENTVKQYLDLCN